MNLSDKVGIIAHLLRWRLSWSRRDIDLPPPPGLAPCFMSARDAARRISDGATVISCGLAANARCSIHYWAVRELFEQTGHPKQLTWISVGGQGGRGRVPGSVEEIGLRGLVRSYISGHLETAKSLLKLADEGHITLHTLPQGEMTHILEAQGEGRDSIRSRTGVGTFLDPRCGRGSPVTPGATENYITPAGDELQYRLPRVDVAVITAPWADRDGNIYFRDAAAMTESKEAARAARFNKGQVLVAVADIVPGAASEITIPASQVDAVIVNPLNEQTGGVPQRKFWPALTPGGDGDDELAMQRLRYINQLLRVTPLRGPAENAVARLGAALFARSMQQDITVNIGVGYGEEMGRVLCEQGLHEQITFTTETGVYGGRPAPGVFFGAAVNPQKLESSAWMFHRYHQRLDAALLGFLQVDSRGNVNASNRGPRYLDYIGPGGLPSITASARTVFFVGGWMSGSHWRIANGALNLKRRGKPKFVQEVREVTFNGQVALAQGKRVFYVTNVGIFRLTAEGLMLIEVMPGIDIHRDILEGSEAHIVLPDGGEVPVAPQSILTGRGFALGWSERPAA
jgi:propionate CoA-transferase